MFVVLRRREPVPLGELLIVQLITVMLESAADLNLETSAWDAPAGLPVVPSANLARFQPYYRAAFRGYHSSCR